MGKQCETLMCHSIKAIDPLVCSGKGTCVAPDKCKCKPLQTEYRVVDVYSGNRCENIMCFGRWSNASIVCHGYGICDSYNNCTCNTGYKGTQCQFDPNSWLWDEEGSSGDAPSARRYFGVISTVSVTIGSIWFAFCLLSGIAFALWKWYGKYRLKGDSDGLLHRDRTSWPAPIDVESEINDE
jgi:hypothetical protein